MFQAFIKTLINKFNDPLPGPNAQSLMMPAESTRTRFDLDKKDVKRGGVLILLYPKTGQVYMPLTQRHFYPGAHGGQVSLPGGKWEEYDESIVSTALRETYEEIGVRPKQVAVIGRLTELYIPPSNFKVTPIVGYMEDEPSFEVDPREVKELIETPLYTLLDGSKRKRKNIAVSNGLRLNAPYFDVKGKVVWGATAMILSEFQQVIADIPFE